MAPLGDSDAAREERDRGDSRAEEQDSRAGDGTALVVQEANLAGAQATQAVDRSGTWSVMAAGAAALVGGIFLGMAIAKS
ncbi:hypothetical protein ACWD62_42765 [Streptomyces sp. NPDC005146]